MQILILMKSLKNAAYRELFFMSKYHPGKNKIILIVW